MSQKNKIIGNLCSRVLSIQKNGPILVGIDGVDGSGKTQFAKTLADALSHSNRPILRSSVDFFHNKGSVRKPQGKKSSVSFFENSFNYPELSRKLLDPLSKSTDSRILSSLIAGPYSYSTEYFFIGMRQKTTGTFLYFWTPVLKRHLKE